MAETYQCMHCLVLDMVDQMITAELISPQEAVGKMLEVCVDIVLACGDKELTKNIQWTKDSLEYTFRHALAKQIEQANVKQPNVGDIGHG